MTPTTWPSPFTTGRWRKWPSTMSAIASGMVVSGEAVRTWLVIRSLTGVVGSVPSLTQRIRSRSVMTPTRSPASSTTIAAPTSDSTMRRAASPTCMSGETVTTSVAMTSVSSIRTSVRGLAGSCDQERGRLEVALDGLEQPGPVRSGAGAVVAGEGHRHDLAGHDGAVAEDRPLEGARHRQDGRLGRVDDRREGGHVEHAHVGHGEGGALDLRLAQLPVARPLDQVARLDGQLSDALRVGVAQHRDDQAVLQRDRDPDMRVGVVDV